MITGLILRVDVDPQVKDVEDFVRRLDCRPDELLKVVSIFGNTGEGKSHTLNHTFFLGREVFKTSPTQESCTVGVWAAMDPVHRVVVIDTEGLLGAGTRQTVNKDMSGGLLAHIQTAFAFPIRCQSRSADPAAPQSPGHLGRGHLQNPRRPSP